MDQSNDEIVKITISEPQAAVLGTRQKLILEMAGQGSGKSQDIGYSSGQKIQDHPKARGFIGANTDDQLTHSTLDRVFKVWGNTYGYTRYDPRNNPEGDFVIDCRPPLHFEKFWTFKRYNNICSFRNGATIFLGSLTNYKSHDGKEFAWAHLDETKDTPEAALTDVILGRLRQFGLWFDESGQTYFDDDITEAESVERGWTAWNPLYIHTSPPPDGLPWLNKMFKLFFFEQEIYKRVTKGANDFFYKEFDDRAVIIYPADHNAENLAPRFLENQRSILGPKKALKLVDGFPFGSSGGEHYSSFDRRQHAGVAKYIKGEAVHQSWDFNYLPYMTLICVQIQYIWRHWDDRLKMKYDEPTANTVPLMVTQVRFYSEYCNAPPKNTTAQTCESFIEDHDYIHTEVYIHGDANGKNHVPGLGSYTNFKEIQELMYQYTHNDSFKVKNNIGVNKRRDFINDVFAGKKHPEIEIIIDLEDCPNLVNDMTFVKQGKDGKFKQQMKDEHTGEKYEAVGHTSDCLDYVMCDLFPEYLKNVS